MERWVLLRKGGDFEAMGEKFNISPRLACLIRNRNVIGEAKVHKFLNGTIEEINDGRLMKGMEAAALIVKKKIKNNQKIRIIGDYDI